MAHSVRLVKERRCGGLCLISRDNSLICLLDTGKAAYIPENCTNPRATTHDSLLAVSC